MKNEIKTFDVDIAWDCDCGSLFESWEKHNLTVVKIIANGPGGGNPNVYLSGKTSDIINYLSEFHFLDTDEIMEMYL